LTALNGIKTVYPSTLQVRLISKLGKKLPVDNKNFSECGLNNRINFNGLPKLATGRLHNPLLFSAKNRFRPAWKRRFEGF
jgi:hypothetical protein